MEFSENCRIRGLEQHTIIQMKNNKGKYIKDIEPGEILYNNVIVTSKIIVTSFHVKMYRLHNIIISGNYHVKYGDTWTTIDNHPDSEALEDYTIDLLYGLNTSNKKIILENTELCDWDNLYNGLLRMVLHTANIFGDITHPQNSMYLNIHKYLDIGLIDKTEIYLSSGEPKYVVDIEIGDELYIGGIVYGKVEIDTLLLENSIKYLGNGSSETVKKVFHLLVSEQKFWLNGKIVGDYNHAINFLTKNIALN